jgi:hypothetical protein
MSGRIGTSPIGEVPIGGFFVQSYTAQDMCTLALKNASLVGTGQTPDPTDLSDVFSLLQGMIGIWSRKRWLIWHLLDVFVPTLQNTQRQYTVGPGGNFDVPRPDRIEYAYFRQFVQPPGQDGGGPVDFPLELYQGMEDYASVALKYLQSWPQAVFYDAAVPQGLLLPVPIPNVPNSELHILIKDTLNQFPSLTTPCNLPPEYFEAIWTNLAIRVAASFPGSNLSPLTVGLAKAALSTIRGANAQIPQLRMPTGMVRPPLFNIYSYQTY